MSSVSGGRGSPLASMAAPPTRASRTFTGTQAPRTESADSITSGPTPSPLKTASVCEVIDVLPWLVLDS